MRNEAVPLLESLTRRLFLRTASLGVVTAGVAANARSSAAANLLRLVAPLEETPSEDRHYLPLGSGLLLAFSGGRIEVRDLTKTYQLDGGASFASPEAQMPEASRQDFAFSLAIVRAVLLRDAGTPDAVIGEVREVHDVSSTQQNGKGTITAHALFSNGVIENWRITTDAANCKWIWERRGQKDQAGSMAYFAETPRREVNLEFWQTGRGAQIVNGAVPGVVEGMTSSLTEAGASETIFYSPFGRSCFLLQGTPSGNLTILQDVKIRDRLPGEPDWEMDDRQKMRDIVWKLSWATSNGADFSRFSGSWSATSAARDFTGFKQLHAVDASADFGPYFAQVYLASLPLTLRKYPGDLIAPRANVLMSQVEAYRDTWSRDNMWNYEFLYLVDPEGVAQLVANYIDWRLLSSNSHSNGGDDAETEILLLAGRHFTISGATDFVRKHIVRYREIAQRLLDSRPPGSFLPLFRGSWDCQGTLVGQEPYATAECFAGLSRLAELEDAAGNSTLARHWREAAAGMTEQALRDYREGGLWHTERGTFINYIDYADPSVRTPRQQTWGTGTIQKSGRVRPEFALYETLVPIWLGLLDDQAKIREAFAWIDKHYTYASGRGGITVPPYAGQTFMLLLDVCIRQKYSLPGAANLFQLLNDRAFDGGIPFTENALGTYLGAGPENPDGRYKFYNATHSGRTWDNAPFFGLVMNMHYGLDYTSKGWRLGTPRPLAGYRTSELTNLRHKDAVYHLEWSGSGTLKSVVLDGKPLKEPLLELRGGEHDVHVLLGQAI